MNQQIVLRVLIPVVETLDRLGIDYYIGGAVASLTHGIYRTTADMIIDAIKHRSEFNVIHLSTMFKVDIFLPKSRVFDRVIRQRVRKRKLPFEGDSVFNMESPEDVILTKLEWYKMGGEVSERQWGDIVGVLKVQKLNLDREYLLQWAAEIGVVDLLMRAFQEIGLS